MEDVVKVATGVADIVGVVGRLQRGPSGSVEAVKLVTNTLCLAVSLWILWEAW